MAIAVFGSKVFEVTPDKIYTFKNFQYSSTLETEDQDAAGKKPSTYNKGPGLGKISFKIDLDTSNGINPRAEIESWEEIKDAGIAYPFILGKRQWGKHKWLLIDVQAPDPVIDNHGNILEVEMSLQFKEYVRAGSASNQSAAASTNAPGISVTPVSGIVSILNPSEKSQLKRKNNLLEV